MTAVTHPPLGVSDTGPAVRGPLARVLLGPVTQAAWIRPALLGNDAARGGRVHLGPGCQRLRQHLLLGGRAGRVAELVGLVLRLVRRGQLHHGRQAAAGHDADGPVGPPVRPQLVEHPPAPGAGRGGHGRPAGPDRPSLVRAGGRHDRRGGHGPHPGERPDLPLQQPRRPPDPAPRGRGRGIHPGA